MLHILVAFVDVRKWPAVMRVIGVRSRIDDEPLSAIRSACARLGSSCRYISREQAPDRLSRRSSTKTPLIDLTELLLTVRLTAGKCSNGRKFQNLIDIDRNVAARSSIINGPCGCHPP
jgi:hypothetical protein